MNANRTAVLIASLSWACAGTSGAQDFQLRIAPVDQIRITSTREDINWDSLGDTSSVPDKSLATSRGPAQRALPSGIQARKAEMVRRMFWLVLAYR